jgi:hypothetical protein
MKRDEKVRPSFLKKRSKKRLLLRPRRLAWPWPSVRGAQQTNVFWFFFSKNNILSFLARA